MFRPNQPLFFQETLVTHPFNKQHRRLPIDTKNNQACEQTKAFSRLEFA
jgi:hypothetical protein